MKNKRIVHIFIGTVLFVVVALSLPKEYFTYGARITVATLTVMIYWWITRPVHIAVTALLPIAINSLFNMDLMNNVLKDYASPIVVLLLGANILTLTWSKTGLDKKIALRALSIIGTSVKGQLAVWFLLSAVLSTVLPNAVVAAAMCPIAYAMISYVDCGETEQKKVLQNMILIMIVWGAGLGGFGTPLGGAMNLVAITHIESFTGKEFMFFSWVLKMMPYLALLCAGMLAYILLSKPPMKRLPGTAEYFKKEYGRLGKITANQTLSLILFVLPVLLSFARPLYAEVLPEFKPYYAFLLFGFIALIIGKEDNRLIKWDYAAKNINWSLMILFSGGLAIGNLLMSTGAISGLSEIILMTNVSKVLPIVALIVAFSMFLSNASSNTAAVAVAIPLVLGIVSVASPEPLRYVYIAAAACNCAFLLPTSIRAIPMGYGLDVDVMFKKGIVGVIIAFAILTAAGWLAVIL